jgi:hypothetical protein
MNHFSPSTDTSNVLIISLSPTIQLNDWAFGLWMVVEDYCDGGS